ncbi:hypothetical protein EHM69_08310 [candidate division KSB1 bacterium]|nr:MAG: hypothetical protein EHM69_08310 [candidate division KSB1 bacterium]
MRYGLFVIGWISILGQVVMLRELAVALYGVELVYLLAIGFWLLGTAAGALFCRQSEKPQSNGVQWLLVLFALLLLLEMAFTRGMRVLFGGVFGAYLPFPAQLAGILIAILPLSVLSGLLFRWSAVAYLNDNKRTLAGAYAIESLGGVLGGLSSTTFLQFGFSNLLIALICSIIAAASAFWLSLAQGEMKKVFGVFNVMAVAAVILAFWHAYPLDRMSSLWHHPHLLESTDTPYGRITVEFRKGQISVFENDALSFESQGVSSEELTHFAALWHPRPEHVLIMGGGCEGIVRDLLQHHPVRVDYVDLSDVLMKTVLPILPPDIQKSLKDPRVHIHFGDPRSRLRGLERYDVIIVGMPEPTSGQSNRFYTREFFDLAKRHLHQNGILALRLRSVENIWPEAIALRNAGVVQALSRVFDDVLVLPGTTNVILASAENLPRNPDVLISRHESRSIQAKLVIPPYVRYVLTNDRLQEISARLAQTAAPVNSDERPVCYYYAGSIWLSKLFPNLIKYARPASAAKSFEWVAGIFTVCFVVLLLMILLFRSSVVTTLIAGIAGFYGMLLEMILLLRFQSANGVLYRDIGLLLTLFMLGLAWGAAWMNRKRNAALRTYGIGILSGACLIGVIVALPTFLFNTASPVWIGILLIAAGFFVSAAFAWTALVRAHSQKNNIAPLYAADLIGGCFGSWLGSLWFMPLYGLTATAAIAAVSMGLAFFAVLRIAR